MSAATRRELAAAASAVDGVTCQPYYRQTTTPGHAFVRRDTTTRSENGFGFMVTWQVLVILPQQIDKAEERADQLTPELVQALDRHLIITSITPNQLALDNGTVPVLVVEGARESE